MKKILTATIVSATAITAPSTAHAAPKTCNEMISVEKQFQAKLPMELNRTTTLIAFEAHCNSELVLMRKQLRVPTRHLEFGWRERKQAEHKAHNCKRDVGTAGGPLGWTAFDYFYDADGKHLVTLVTYPSEC